MSRVSSIAADPSGPPGPYPLPPADLAERILPLREFPSPVWFRGHRTRHGPIFFNRAAGRFAAPAGEFGVLYLGEDELVSFAEAFNHEFVAAPFGPIVSGSNLAAYCLCPVAIDGTVRLVDLTNGPALVQLSLAADNRINDGPHAVAQHWSLAFWDHPSAPDGLLYRSRRAPERRAIALFDRLAPELRTNCAANLLRDSARLTAILDHYGIALIP